MLNLSNIDTYTDDLIIVDFEAKAILVEVECRNCGKPMYVHEEHLEWVHICEDCEIEVLNI